jgi:hypothetical protein
MKMAQAEALEPYPERARPAEAAALAAAERGVAAKVEKVAAAGAAEAAVKKARAVVARAEKEETVAAVAAATATEVALRAAVVARAEKEGETVAAVAEVATVEKGAAMVAEVFREVPTRRQSTSHSDGDPHAFCHTGQVFSWMANGGLGQDETTISGLDKVGFDPNAVVVRDATDGYQASEHDIVSWAPTGSAPNALPPAGHMA